MKTNNLPSIVRMGILIISCTALLASCTTETEEAVEPLYTMGDPKNSSAQGSRCFEISEFTLEGESVTLNYEEIIWTFQNNGVVIAGSPNQEWSGSWNIGQADGDQKLFLNFPGAPPFIDAVSGIWTIVSSVLTNPQFIKDEGGPNPATLQFTQTDCAIISPELETLNALLRDSLFIVANFIYEGNDLTDLYSDVIFDFKENNTVIAERFGQQKGGQWMTSETQDGILLTLQFNPPPAPLTNFNAAWTVVSFDSSVIVLEYLDGPPDTGSFYTIELVNAG